MDTTQVPQIKLAKVGKERDKKKAGAWWNFGRSAGNWQGAVGGAGRAGVGMLSLGQGAATAVALVLGLGAYTIGGQLAPGGEAAAPSSKVFDQREQAKVETKTAAGPALPSGLAMVNGSLDGKTPEQRAAEAAEAKRLADEEAARKAAEEEAARKKAEEEAKAAEAAAAAQVPEAAAPVAAAAEQKAAPAMASKFGQLSSGTGGSRSGLSGGAGMSGGVGRSFAPVNSRAGAGDARGMGTTKAPAKQTAKAGKAPKAIGRGKAFRQLNRINGLTRSGLKSNALETMTTQAGEGFNGNKGAGTVISGQGAQSGNSNPDDAPTSGGPVTGGPQGGGADGTSGVGNVNQGANVSPWQKTLDKAKGMLIAAMLALVILGIWSAMSNTVWTFWMKALIIAIAVIIAAAGALIIQAGHEMNSLGAHKALGGLYMGAGAMVVVAAGTVAYNAYAGAGLTTGVAGGIGIAATAIGAVLGVVANVGVVDANEGADGTKYSPHGVPGSL